MELRYMKFYVTKSYFAFDDKWVAKELQNNEAGTKYLLYLCGYFIPEYVVYVYYLVFYIGWNPGLKVALLSIKLDRTT